MNPKIILFLLLSAFTVSACSGTGSTSVEQEASELENRQNKFFDALSSKDLENMLSLFSEDAILQIAGRSAVEGRDAIKELYSIMFGFMNSSSANLESIRVSRSGDMGYSTGSTVNSFSGPQGEMEYEGKYLLIWEKEEGQWLISIYSISSNS